MKCIIGKKINMTQVFKDDGSVVPVTRVQAGPCVVTQIKSEEKDGVNAIQLGFGEQKAFRINKAQTGHFKELPFNPRVLKDTRMEEGHSLKRGDVLTVNSFEAGEKVSVQGNSKGRGFQGVVKRHGFAGSPASHGHKDQLRMPGSIGATDAARVFKGTRMGGHMGDAQVTVKNLEIVQVDTDTNELFIKGAVPGARGSLLVISTVQGNMEAFKQEEKKDDVAVTEEKKMVQEEAKEVVEAPKDEVKPEENQPQADQPIAEKSE